MTDEIDTWLRGSGLPWLVPRGRWGRHLVQRTAPMVALVLGTSLVDEDLTRKGPAPADDAGPPPTVSGPA